MADLKRDSEQPIDNGGGMYMSGVGVNATSKNVTYNSTNPENQDVASVSMSTLSVQMNPSPLPSADILEQYARLIPDAPERFLKLVEKEQEHRFITEDTITDTNKTIAKGKLAQIKRGQVFGFILALIILGLGTLFVFTGHDTIAYVLFVMSLASVIGIFVGRSKDNQPNKEKD